MTQFTKDQIRDTLAYFKEQQLAFKKIPEGKLYDTAVSILQSALDAPEPDYVRVPLGGGHYENIPVEKSALDAGGGVVLTDDEWEDMVNQQECLNAEIADLQEEIAELKALTQQSTTVAGV
jgi:hypothetical protein